MTAEMGLNISPFQAGLRQAGAAAERGFAAMAGALKTSIAGYFGWQALKASVLDVAHGMKEIKDRSEQLSITTDEVQKLGVAAENTGLTFEDMANGLQRLGAARAAALKGDEDKIAALNRFGAGGLIGTNASDLEVMKRVGESLRGMKVDSETLQMLRELFGRSGARLVEALKEINSSQLGPIINKESIDAMHELEIQTKALGRDWKAGVAPAIEAGSAALTHFLLKFKEVRDEIGQRDLPWYGKPGSVVVAAMEAFKRAEDEMKNGVMVFTGKGTRRDNARRAAGLPPLGPVAAANQEPTNFINPKAVEAMRDAQLKLEEKISSVIFDRADSEGKIGILKKQIKDADQAMSDLATLRNQKLIDEVEYQQRIAEWKSAQLDSDQKIYDLNRKGGGGSFEAFRRLARVGGFGGLAAGNSETVSILKSIEAGLGRGKVILGR